jgi:hypothetical protein
MSPIILIPDTKQSIEEALKPEPEEALEYDAYLDDEPVRKPKTGKTLRKFKHPGER